MFSGFGVVLDFEVRDVVFDIQLINSPGYAVVLIEDIRHDQLDFAYHDDIHDEVGKQLNQGKVIARYFGRMEWGARALGNRSIIADARRPDIIIRINEAIKNRDFWMPFAPSVVYERVEDYFENPKGFFAPYMVMAFPSTPLARQHLRGALHPYDFSGRPQMVKEDWNPDYYRVLKSFEKASGGVGGILNTSFNLHGEAIVRTPSDALDTFLNSGLDALAIGNYLVTKRVPSNGSMYDLVETEEESPQAAILSTA